MKDNETELPVRGVVPLTGMAGDDAEDTRLLGLMASAARDYLAHLSWCKALREEYFGDGYGGIVAVFLFRIEPAQPEVDEWLWVIFGDVPPAYLVTDSCKTPSEALVGYIEEMSKWVELAKESRSSKDVIPVNVPATPENAADLEKRLKFLTKTIVPAFREAETVRA